MLYINICYSCLFVTWNSDCDVLWTYAPNMFVCDLQYRLYHLSIFVILYFHVHDDRTILPMFVSVLEYRLSYTSIFENI
jgi:hypothetical protein